MVSCEHLDVEFTKKVTNFPAFILQIKCVILRERNLFLVFNQRLEQNFKT